MRITAIATQKGGTGKTTTAQALVDGLTLAGYKPLAIDADPQGNLTQALGAAPGSGLYDALKKGRILKYIQSTDQGDILAATPELIQAQIQTGKRGQEYALRDALEALDGRYDHVIIDCPPGLGVLTLNALTAAQDVVIPIEAAIFSLQGLAQLYSTLQLIQQKSNPDLKIAGILLNKFNPRSVVARDTRAAIEETAAKIGTQVYRATIRQAVAIQEAQTLQENILLNYRAKVAADLADFIKEYLKQEDKRK